MARRPLTRKEIAQAVIGLVADLAGVQRASISETTRLDAALDQTGPQRARLVQALNRLPILKAGGVALRSAALVNARTIGDVVDVVFEQARQPEAIPVAAAPTPTPTRQAVRKARARTKSAAPKPGRSPSSGAKRAAKKKSVARSGVRRSRTKKSAIQMTVLLGSDSAPGEGAPGSGSGPRALSFRAMRAPVAERAPRADRAPRAKRAVAPKSRPATATIRRRKPRYANVALFEPSGRKRLDSKKALRDGQIMCLRIDIGALSKTSQVSSPEPIPEEKLPENIDLSVMVSSTDFAVADASESLRAETPPRVAHGSFHLPADGSAATTREGAKYLYFFLKAPPRGIGHARIGYYYKNILVQSQHLTARIGGRGGFKIVTDYTVSADLTGLGRLPARPRMSLFTNANGNGGSHQIVLRNPGTPPAGADKGATIEIKAASVDDVMGTLRSRLSLYAPEEKLRPKSKFITDLTQLAPVGWNLYTGILGQLPAASFANLYENPDAYVVQVSRPTSSSFVVPWAYMYDIPLNSKVKPTLCPLVDKWDGKAPLFQGSPRKCPCGPHDEDVLCPFGFWGFRYALEQLSSSDDPVLTIPVSQGSTFAVGEAQYGLDTARLAAHVGRLKAILKTALPQAELSEGQSRAAIRDLMGRDLPFVYFFCHGERANVADANTWLGVGKQETITAADFIGWTLVWSRKAKVQVWNAVRPLVFINACHTLAIEAKTLVSYVEAFVGTGRAAGVIGTEVKVSQTLAMDFAEQFYTSWLSGKETIESALRSARMDYLRQGNIFGLVYTPYCWSDLKVV